MGDIDGVKVFQLHLYLKATLFSKQIYKNNQHLEIVNDDDDYVSVVNAFLSY